MKQEQVTEVAKELGKEYLFPCVMLAMVLGFLYLTMGPVFSSTAESFKQYIILTEKRLAIEERIAVIMERQYRRSSRHSDDETP